MNNKHIFKSFIALSASLFLFAACNLGKGRQAPKGKNIICVVDFSDSKNATERLQFYSDVIKKNIIPTLGLYDDIRVIPIDKSSVTNSTDIFSKDLSAKNFEPEQASPKEEEEITLNNLKLYKDTLALEFAQNFKNAITNRSKSQHGTDIFGALKLVAEKQKQTDDNYVIFLSDMMNWSSALNMEPDNKDFNSHTLDNILSKVPNYAMPNTTALVLTAEQVEVSPEHFQLVESFWKKYFEKNQIKLFDYNSASLDKLNELMALPVSDPEKK